MVKKNSNRILTYLIVILIVFVALNFILSMSNYSIEQKEPVNSYQKESFLNIGDSTKIRMELPAIDPAGNGVYTYLSVEAVKGTGRTLVDIENLLFWADTQQSIRMARLVADNYTGDKSVSDFDLVYNIEANASVIGGPSAGAALTIATIFAINSEKPREDVMITGTINHDGSIGPISGVLEKAKASKQAGANLFLVPLLQSEEILYDSSQHCQQFGNTEICTTETKPRKVNISEEAQIKVIEVANISEALDYFRNG